jgi:nucleoside-diphosphate-sugar epimerase
MTQMSENSDLHVVFGASGGAGGATVRELVARGKRVRAVTRSGGGDLPTGVEAVRADAANRLEARRACEGATVVYHAVNVPYPAWAETLPPVMDGLIDAAGAAGATLVYADNLYAYGPVDRPMTEDLPAAATTRKGKLRARLAETLLAAHHAGTVRAVIGRGSDYYGPGVRHSAAGERLFPAVLSGGKAMWAGSLDQPHSLTFIDDFARVLVTLGEREEALGQVWHAPLAEALTGRQFIELAFAEAGKPPKIGTVSPLMIRLVGLVNPMVRELGELIYEFEAPFILDGSKYRQAFGGAPTPHREAIRATLGWYADSPVSADTPRRSHAADEVAMVHPIA